MDITREEMQLQQELRSIFMAYTAPDISHLLIYFNFKILLLLVLHDNDLIIPVYCRYGSTYIINDIAKILSCSDSMVMLEVLGGVH